MAPPVGAMLGPSPMDAPVAHAALGDLRGLPHFKALIALSMCLAQLL
jgi:hypothetical protein